MMRLFGVVLLFVYAAALTIVPLIFMVSFWGAVGSDGPLKAVNVHFLLWDGKLPQGSTFVLVTIAGGALGGALHGLGSLTAHLAKGDLTSNWTFWYLANPLNGAALATVFLFVLQAGLLQGQLTSGSLYGVAALATLSGLFSRVAMRKLKDIFNTAFAPGPEPEAAPAIGKVAPNPLRPSDGPTITLTGTGFAKGSEVLCEDVFVTPAGLSDTMITFELPATLRTPGTVRLWVRVPDGAWSNAAGLEVR